MLEENKNEDVLDEEEFCHYSGLPSPLAYQELNKEQNESNK
jgi:hypothetical protein